MTYKQFSLLPSELVNKIVMLSITNYNYLPYLKNKLITKKDRHFVVTELEDWKLNHIFLLREIDGYNCSFCKYVLDMLPEKY